LAGKKSQLDFVSVVRSKGDALLSLATSYAKKKLLGIIISKLPFLASGPLGWIASILLGKLVSWAFTELFEVSETGIIFMGINITVDEQTQNYVEAHQELGKAKTKKEKKDAQSKVDNAFRDYVNLN